MERKEEKREERKWEDKYVGGHWLDEQTYKRLMSNRERLPDPMRYKKGAVGYRRAGRSGLKLPEVSLGLWHNFGSMDNFEVMRDMVFTAFDNGVCHFDLANNYGPRGGSAEENFGKIVRENFSSYRDELCVSTKAGFGMWKGPYGDGGSIKYLTASLDQSLKRLGLPYVDIFYHHRPAPETPIEETCYALDRLVRQGKALYVGVSNYSRAQTEAAIAVFRELRTPFILNQSCYNLLDRRVETDGLKELALREGFGIVAYSPLAQGLLTDKYRYGIPEDSRIRKSFTLREEKLTPELLGKLERLRGLAAERGQTLPELALSWVLRDEAVTSVIVGASSPAQILDNIKVDSRFTAEELSAIEEICGTKAE